MSWKDNMRRVTMPDGRKMIGASFRGVAFYVEETSRNGGRRQVVHEFPARSEPEIEDNGRKAASFAITGYVLGAGYVAQRDLLLEALEDVSGPGEFIHPSYGSMLAACGPVKTKETTKAGGQASFTVTFHRAPGIFFDSLSEPDHPAIVNAYATAALAAAGVELEDRYSVSGQPSFATESLATEYVSVVTVLGDVLAGVVFGTQELARLNMEISIMVARASSIIRSPADVVTGLVSVISSLVGTIESTPRPAITALLAAYSTAAGLLAPPVTATRRREHANHAALSAAIRRILAVEAARLLPYVEHATYADAINDRTAVVALLDEQAAIAGDATYPALIQLRAVVTRAIPGEKEYARQITREQRVSVPSLVLSYDLYGSVDQEADILARNAVSHPAFLHGTLTVRSDG